MQGLFLAVLYVMIAVSVVGSAAVIIDKRNAIRSRRRISEATLMFLGFFGGALLMYLFMKLVRHKTKKPKFMVSFPLFSVLHIIILFLCYR